MLNLGEHNQYFVDKFLIVIGFSSGGIGLSLTAISVALALALQVTGLISFVVFLIINHEKIQTESKKLFKKIFKKKK